MAPKERSGDRPSEILLFLGGDIRIERRMDRLWGDAIAELESRPLQARIINLESVIDADHLFPLTTGAIDACALANDGILARGLAGLDDTQEALARVGIRAAGAGYDANDARHPAVIPVGSDRRVLLYALAAADRVPITWSASDSSPGLHVVSDLSDAGARAVTDRIARDRRPGDVVVVSIHWGSPWGYEVPPEHIRFAHRLVENGADVVHGHGSRHPRPIEVWNRKLILYGCGSLVTDDQAQAGFAAFRRDLVLMYFVRVAAETGDLVDLEMAPLQVAGRHLQHAYFEDARWLAQRLTRVSEVLGAGVEYSSDGGTLHLRAGGHVLGGPVDDARLATMLAPPHAV